MSMDYASAVARIRAMAGQTVGDGQCYALSGYYIWLISDKDISYSNGHPMLDKIGAGVAASNIGTDWDFGAIGWSVVNASNDKLCVGAVANIGANVGSPWYTGGWGHTGVITGLDSATVEFTQQNYAGRPTGIYRYDRTSFCTGLTTLCIPPGASGGTEDPGKPPEEVPTSGVNVLNVDYNFFEITCDEARGYKSNSTGSEVIDIFYKCNKITGDMSGDWLIYNKFDNTKGYIQASCVKPKPEYKKTIQRTSNGSPLKSHADYDTGGSENTDPVQTEKVYSLSQFMMLGRIEWGNYEYTYYSQSVLPGTGLNIPGRHVNADGYVADGDGYIVLAAPIDWGNVKGRTYPTPFGYTGKVYDANGTPHSHSGKPVLDVYIR